MRAARWLAIVAIGTCTPLSACVSDPRAPAGGEPGDTDDDPPPRDDDGDGMSAAAGDCDDGDGAVNPAAAEVCGDHVDNDGDGRADGRRSPRRTRS